MNLIEARTKAGWEELVVSVIDRGKRDAPGQKQDRSRRREARILEAALKVFARDGIARARIADIAAEAGVPVASIYDYFPAKEDIAYAVPIVQMREFLVEFARRARAIETARERLRFFLWLTADFARRHPHWARTLYLEVWPSVMVEQSRVRQSLDDYGRIMVALIRDGERSGEWAVDPDPYQTTTIFIGSSSQLIITWLLYKRPRNLMKAVGALAERLLSLLPASSGRRRTQSAPRIVTST